MYKNALIVFLVILVSLLVYQVNALAPAPYGDTRAEVAETTTPETGVKPTAPKKATAPVIRRDKDGVYLISYTDAGFSPSTLEITRGSTVRWTNNSNKGLWVETTDLIDRQPTNEMNGSATLSKGETYSFTFTKPYVYGYRNKNDVKAQGAIIVK